MEKELWETCNHLHNYVSLCIHISITNVYMYSTHTCTDLCFRMEGCARGLTSRHALGPPRSPHTRGKQSLIKVDLVDLVIHQIECFVWKYLIVNAVRICVSGVEESRGWRKSTCRSLTDYVRIEECLVMYLALTWWTCPTLITFRSIRKYKECKCPG